MTALQKNMLFLHYFENNPYLCTQIMAIWWLMPPDARESSESPELFLQL